MYESPIELVYHETFPKLIKQQENLIMQGCLDVGVYVDKEELIKALQYDRDQYRKGYEDAVYKTHGTWVDKWHTLWKQELPICSVCNNFSIFKSDYCPNCGADMRGEKDVD